MISKNENSKRISLFCKKFFFIFFGLLIFSSTFFLHNVGRAFAVAPNGYIRVTQIKDELGNTLLGTFISFRCTGRSAVSITDGGVGDNDGSNNGSIEVKDVDTGGCVNSDSFMYASVGKDGYAFTSISSTLGTYTTSAANTYSASTANLFAHKVTGQDELGNSLTGATVTVGGTSCTESSGVYYCATPVANDGVANDVIVTKAGYVKYLATSTDRVNGPPPTGQVTYTSSNPFALKSAVLKSEIGGAITGIASGISSADVTLSASGGAAIVAYQVSGNVLYIAATGNGTATGGVDIVSVALSNVTADGGTANGASFIGVGLADSSQYLYNSGSSMTVQKTFDIGSGGSGNIVASGARYPLKVSTAYESGVAVNISDLGTFTYNGSSPYYTDGASTAYFGNVATGGALVINKSGYINAASTNTGLTSVTTTQTGSGNANHGQVIITMQNDMPQSSALVADTTYDIKGLAYNIVVIGVQNELGVSIMPTSGTPFSGPSTPIVSQVYNPDNGYWYLAVPTDNGVVRADVTGYVRRQLGVDPSATVQKTIAWDPAGLVTADAEASVGLLFQLKVVVKDELDNAINISDLGTATFDGSISTANDGTNTVYWAPTGGVVTRGALLLAKDGYVNSNVTNTSLAASGSTGITTNTSTQILISMSQWGALYSDSVISSDATLKGLQYGQKVTVTREGDGLALSGATVSHTHPDEACPEDGSTGVYYCALSPEYDGGAGAFVSKDGYVYTTGTTIDRTNGTSPQGEVTVSNVQFAYKITGITNERDLDFTTFATSLTVGDETGQNTCILASGAWYCPVSVSGPANSDGTMVGNVFRDGYVQADHILAVQTNRTLNSDAQVSDTISGIQYSHKVTAQDELGNPLSIANVSVGGYGCSESGTSGVYYCVVPVAADGGVGDVSISKDGYVTYTTNSTDRSATTAQGSYTSANLFTLKVTVTNSVGGAPVTGSTITVQKDDDAGTAISTPDATVSNVQYFALDPAIYNTATVSVAKTNFITNSASANLIASSSQQALAFDLVELVAPGAPTGLSATATSTTQINLSWTAPASDGGSTITGYKIERKTGSGDYSSIVADTGTNGTTYSNTSLSAGTAYTYKVSTINAIGTGVASSEASATTSSDSGGGSGGGGGGSISSQNQTVSLSLTPSDTTQVVKNAVDLPSSGFVARPVLINGAGGSSILIPKDTSVTTSEGVVYDGKISAPVILSESKLLAPLPQGLFFNKAIVINTGKSVVFDKEITITIPLNNGQDLKDLKIYYYDEKTKQYLTAGDGGQISADGKSISVKVNHLTTFVVTQSGDKVEGLPFLDVSGHWAVPYISNVYTLGIMKGAGDGTKFLPNNSLTRSEMAKIAVMIGKYDLVEKKANFNDVDQSTWYAPYVNTIKDKGVMIGYADNKFRPAKNVTRGEALKILFAVTGTPLKTIEKAQFLDVPKGTWYQPFVDTAYQDGIVKGRSETLFAPNADMSRAEVAKVITLFLKLK
ncbi:MAG: S-layer homology domain-containing protein [Candidatus Peregrinibacteria bacterium]|nr:S-layer homology domain-containing protein [Candidatus Peregrinibacteria bacterium]